MECEPAGGVTELLRRWNSGDEAALDILVPILYAELHRLAQIYLRGERSGHTLQTTALVNEAYLRLVDSGRVAWRDRTHFLAVSATLIRRVLIDYARARTAQKRASDGVMVSLDHAVEIGELKPRELVALDDALEVLAKLDPRKARVVELRFFSGLEVRETAEALGISEDTVLRDWKMAKVWLLHELRGHRNP